MLSPPSPRTTKSQSNNMLFLPLLLCMLLLLMRSVVSAAASTTPLPPDYFDRLRHNPNTTYTNAASANDTNSNLLWVHNNHQNNNETSSYRLADITTFLPFSSNGVARYSVHNDAAVCLLAARHFNTQAEDRECNIRLTLELWDTAFSPIETTRVFTQILQRQPTLAAPLPAAVVGAYRSATTSPLAILTGVNDIPQVSATSTATDFDVKEQFPRFGRTITSSQEEARVALELFQSWNASHIGVLFVTDAYGSALQKAFQDGATSAGITTDSIAFSFSADLSGDEIANAISNLRKTQYRMFYAICFEPHYESIMQAAYQSGIVGDDFVWIFPGLDMSTFYKTAAYAPGSPLALATPGIGVLQQAGGVTPDPWLPDQDRTPPLSENPQTGFEKFRTAWRESLQDEEWVAYVRSKYPASLLENEELPVIIEGWDRDMPFSQEPTTNGPFLYDAVLSLGLAMCEAESENGFLTGSQVYQEFLNLRFEGATGPFVVHNVTGTRISHPFVLSNLQAYQEENDENENDQNTNLARFAMYPSRVFENGVWKDVAGNDFRFANGGTTPPKSLPQVEEDKNYIGRTGRAIGYTLMGIVMILSLASLVWLAWHAKERAVRNSQPIFLCMVSVGSFLMASAIIPMSLEEDIGSISEEGLDKACQAVPWLYAVGAIVAFSALFAKTRAIYQAYSNPELNFIHVTTWDIMIGFVILLVLNLIVLITWTFVAPLEWERNFNEATDPFGRPVDSYGICANEDALPFVVVLTVINLGILVLANWWAYKARNIETEYHESRYIAISMASVLQAWCMGIPILIMVWNNPQARFFVGTGIVFVTSLAVLGLIFVPKIIAASQDRSFAVAEEKRQAYRSHVERKSKLSSDDPEDNDGATYNSSLATPTQRALLLEAANSLRVSEDQLLAENMPSTPEVGADDDEKEEVDFQRSDTLGGLPPSSPPFCETITEEEAIGELQRSKRSLRFIPAGGAMKAGDAEPGMDGIKVLHNPRSERNLALAQGRELSKAQLVAWQSVTSEDDSRNHDEIRPAPAVVSARNVSSVKEEESEEIAESPRRLAHEKVAN